MQLVAVRKPRFHMIGVSSYLESSEWSLLSLFREIFQGKSLKLFEIIELLTDYPSKQVSLQSLGLNDNNSSRI